MAVNNVELERIKQLKDRINKADEKINDIFKVYTIPDDITDSNIKLSYALSEIGDDQVARKDLRTKFEDVQKEFEITSKNIEEDFINMTNLGNARIEKTAKDLKIAEERLNKQKSENKLDKIKVLDERKKIFSERLEEIRGPKGEREKLIQEANEIKKKIADIDAKLKAIDDQIRKNKDEIKNLTDQYKNSKDLDEREKLQAQINTLESDNLNLEASKIELVTQSRDAKDKKVKCEANIDSLDREAKAIDNEIESIDNEKEMLESDVKFLVEAEKQLQDKKVAFAKEKADYIKTVEEVEKNLNERGIKVEAAKIVETLEVEKNEITEPVAEESVKEEAKAIDGENNPIVGQESTVAEERPENSNKHKNKSNNVQGNNENYVQQGAPVQGGTLPIVTPENKKKENFEYITGYSSDGAILSSEDRLKRIQSEFDGKDYETMTKAFEELKKSPIKLTKDEKNKIKETLLLDKKNLALNIKDLDPEKLTKLSESVGIDMTEKEVKSLYYYSFDQKDKDSDGYGDSNYGILSGFGSMPAESKSKWEEVVRAYAKNKGNLPKEDIANFEKYVMTPLKFGTLHQQGKELYDSPISKAWSKVIVQFQGGSKLIEDIRSAITEAELPEGDKISSEPKNFTDTLKDQTEKYPPDRDEKTKSDEERNKDGR